MTRPAPPAADDPRLGRLEEILRGCGGCLVAYSGGVDSTLLLAAAARALPGRVAALTVRTFLHEPGETDEARRRAAELGVPHETLEIDLEGHPEVVANPPDRCYLCKRLIFTTVIGRARALGLPVAVDATHLGDRGERRPGLRALGELGVRSPLAEAGLAKDDVRELSRLLGIPGADRPAGPCLATRIPYGEPLTRERLRRVAGAELVLRGLGFPLVRVRDHGDVARVELPARDIARAVDPPVRRGIEGPLRDLGYRYVALDLGGYRTGSMDEALAQSEE